MARFQSFRTWIHGLLAVAISSFATAASGAICLPSVFSFTKDGAINMLKVAAIPAALAALGYLKQSPLPAESITVTSSTTIEAIKQDTP